MDTKSVVITGSLGFIFSHVTEHFLASGWRVYGIDNHSAGSHQELIEGWENGVKQGLYIHHKLDVSDERVIKLVADINPSYIIHAAANSDVDYSLAHAQDSLRNNTTGNINLFEAARKCTNLKKMLYVNTDEVYGESKYRKQEDEILFPKNPYSAGKATGALFRYAYDNSFPELKDKTTETRFCNVFGPRQDDRKVIPRIIHALNTGEPMPVHNDGTGYREYIYVKNIPPIVEQILTNSTQGRTYNITMNDGYTVKQVIDTIEKLTQKKVPTIQSHREGMDMKYQMDASRVTEEFDWLPEWSFTDGLTELLTQNGLL